MLGINKLVNELSNYGYVKLTSKHGYEGYYPVNGFTPMIKEFPSTKDLIGYNCLVSANEDGQLVLTMDHYEQMKTVIKYFDNPKLLLDAVSRIGTTISAPSRVTGITRAKN